jgi:hypothetical protein
MPASQRHAPRAALKGAGKVYEIVRVVEAAFLIDASRRACRYQTPDGQPLVAGYYLALWPAGVSRSAGFTLEVRYFGPFASRFEAELCHDSATMPELIAAGGAGKDVAIRLARCTGID